MDSHIRQAERDSNPARALLLRQRAGLVVPGYTDVREVACDDVWHRLSATHSSVCGGCRGTGSVPFDPWDLIRLRAYCGVACRLCGVTGRERCPRIGGGNYSARDVKRVVREHAEEHVEKALEEHRQRLLEVEGTVDS